MFSPNLATVNYFHTDTYLWPHVVFMIIGLISHHMSSMIKKSISLPGLTADWSSGVWRRWSTRTGWPRMKISGSHRSGEFRNLGEFRKLSTFQVPQHREQGDNTGRLKVMDNNPKTWQLQDLPVYKVLLIFPKKTTICRILFQFGEHAAFWGLWEQVDPDKDLQCQLYLHLWPHMVPNFSHSVHLNGISLHHNAMACS